MSDRSSAYTILGIVSAGAVALLSAPYRSIDASVLLFAALMIVQYCLRRVELPAWLRVSRPEMRSRVFRYSEVAKKHSRDASDRSWLLGDKSSVFAATELRNLPREELTELEAKLRAAGRTSE